MLYWLRYQVIWELVTLWVRNIPVEVKDGNEYMKDHISEPRVSKTQGLVCIKLYIKQLDHPSFKASDYNCNFSTVHSCLEEKMTKCLGWPLVTLGDIWVEQKIWDLHPNFGTPPRDVDVHDVLMKIIRK